MSKTYHTIIKNNELLQDIASYYNSIKRKAFARISKNNYMLFKHYVDNVHTNHSQINEIKKDEIKKPFLITQLSAADMKDFRRLYGMTGRQINSINFEIHTLISAQIEIRNNLLKDKKQLLKDITKDIAAVEKDIALIIKNNDKLLTQKNCSYIKKQLNAYNEYYKNLEIKKYNNSQINYDNKKLFIFYYKNYHLPNILKKKSIEHYLDKNKIDKTHFKVVQQYAKKNIELQKLNAKKNKLDKTIKKIEQDINNGKIRICFGSKKLFKSQSYIKENIDK